MLFRFLAAAVALLAACGPADPAPMSPPPPRCAAPAGISARPTSIDEVVQLINALALASPAPATLPCFLESLQRPLEASASRSLFSFQPAAGSRSPRIFLYRGPLVMTLVPEGKGSVLIEFGQFVDATRTLKGEVAFPVTGPLALGETFTRIRDKIGTTCRGCHDQEVAAPEFHAEAFVSEALRPDDRSLVDLVELAAERKRCDPAAEPERCAMLRALFDHGEVRARDFPAHVPTIFD